MAFFGMIFVGIFIISVILLLLFLVAAIGFRHAGKKKNSKKLTIVGNVFVVLSLIVAIPVLAVFRSVVYDSIYEEVILPDGSEEYVLDMDVDKMKNLMTQNENGIDELINLLDVKPNLVYYQDENRESILDYGLKNGEYDIVRTALDHGAEFDDINRYDHMAYVHNSMDFYLDTIIGRNVSEDDVKILELMLKTGVSLNYSNTHEGVYSNLFGKAVWSVLYNDETVTDVELEFIQEFMQHGLNEDENLLLYEEKPSNISFSPNYHVDVEKDDNYYKLMEIIGK